MEMRKYVNERVRKMCLAGVVTHHLGINFGPIFFEATI